MVHMHLIQISFGAILTAYLNKHVPYLGFCVESIHKKSAFLLVENVS